MKYKVSCILCHHKGRLIDKAVDSILKSRFVETQIIVVTSDDSYQDSRVKVVFQHGGPAHKRNVGFRFAEHRNIAFLDDDIEVRPWALYEMAHYLKRHDVGMVFGKLLNMEFPTRFDEAGSFLTWSGFLWARAESGCDDLGQFQCVEEVLAGKSASCMIDRKVFARVGMFDASYEILGEETDLAWRVWLSGSRVLYIPSSVTLHAFNTKFKPTDMYTPRRVYFNGCRNYITMLLTNLSLRELIIPFVVQNIVWLVAVVGFLITGKTEAGINVLRGLLYVYSNFPHIMAKRRKVQASRIISDRDLLPIIRRSPPISYYIKRLFSYIKTGRHG